jgi:hypothetical protein
MQHLFRNGVEEVGFPKQMFGLISKHETQICHRAGAAAFPGFGGGPAFEAAVG